MKTGIELITDERNEQLEKHGWSETHDSEHFCDELVNAAAYALEPCKYNRDQVAWANFISKIDSKSEIGRLAVAGALIAAEIDRLLNI